MPKVERNHLVGKSDLFRKKGKIKYVSEIISNKLKICALLGVVVGKRFWMDLPGRGCGMYSLQQRKSRQNGRMPQPQVVVGEAARERVPFFPVKTC